jgi:ABC-type multidrug transport system fused ATPase/permease subunit
VHLYRRILSYLRPYTGLFLVSVVAMVVFSALDAFSMTLLIPFLSVLFQDPERAGWVCSRVARAPSTSFWRGSSAG